MPDPKPWIPGSAPWTSGTFSQYWYVLSSGTQHFHQVNSLKVVSSIPGANDLELITLPWANKSGSLGIRGGVLKWTSLQVPSAECKMHHKLIGTVQGHANSCGKQIPLSVGAAQGSYRRQYRIQNRGSWGRCHGLLDPSPCTGTYCLVVHSTFIIFSHLYENSKKPNFS